MTRLERLHYDAVEQLSLIKMARQEKKIWDEMESPISSDKDVFAQKAKSTEIEIEYHVGLYNTILKELNTLKP